MQYEKHKNAKKILTEIDKSPQNYLIIHYSCESFYNIIDGHTPRITSIAVYSFHSAQTDSFSIHKSAEKKHLKLNEIDNKYDELEFSMLKEFFNFVKEHKNFIWIHWNMRDINYGFQAIEHRFEVLGGKPVHVENQNKIDLARLLISYYGVNYIGHPRMESLIELNHISAKDYLNGQAEADAFEKKDYINLHRSTLRKVDVFSNIINKVLNNTLIVKSKWKDKYGISIQSCFEVISKKWWWSIVILFLGALIGKIF
ncbi:MAG: hypothetical protein R3Y24_14900 [Eubacteriales bacterium]